VLRQISWQVTGKILLMRQIVASAALSLGTFARTPMIRAEFHF
jgi:hypothetical protein